VTELGFPGPGVGGRTASGWAGRLPLLLALGLLLLGSISGAELPAQYFRILQTGMAQVEERLAAEPASDLQALEARPGWRHFPSAVLAAAVLFSQPHAANRRQGDRQLLTVSLKIGDLLASELAKGRYATRLDHHRDTYMWLEAFRLLEQDLGEPRKQLWRRALIETLTPLAAEVAKRQDYPWYQSPYIGTSPNHYSLWSSTLYLAGKVFGNREWESLGGKVMRRFAVEEQAPDGFWGEHSRAGPTTGYDYLTASGVALYWEHSRDPAALEALRRSTDFHKHYTYPDGTPVETINDRNRYWPVSMWGHFGFSHFPDGRRYAEFLTSFYRSERPALESLGRIAQNALYFHEGPTTSIPQLETRIVHQMRVPAGIRKAGPWVICLSGLISTSAATSRFYLDRQGHVSIFHEKLGLIVTGANSKRQAELATFWEKIGGQVFHMPLSSRLQMTGEENRLSLAYNSFFAVMEVAIPSEKEVALRFHITPKGRGAESQLNLQLCLKQGQILETGAGRKLLVNSARIDLPAEEIGGRLRHNGWTLRTDLASRLIWPVFPHNPYSDAPETGLERAVATLSTPLQAGPQEISFRLEAGSPP